MCHARPPPRAALTRAMLQKKICMLGAFGVGKTSLVRRYVQSIFSDSYLTTVGVKIEKKTLDVDGNSLILLLWDIAGEDEVSPIRTSYLRGAAGYFLVADGTRAETLDVARSIQTRVEAEVGRVPFLLLLNKADLTESWDVSAGALGTLEDAGWRMVRTSAKSGQGVEEAFQDLAKRLLS
jgi:small GTP-binding protein